MMSGLYTRIVVIQPICAIDEYARIFRSWVWFKPPHPPIMIERSPMSVRRGVLRELWIWCRMERGAIFCHVSRRRDDFRFTPWATSGSQKWKGATPNFMVNAMVRRKGGMWLFGLRVVQWPEYMRLRRIAIIRIIEAVA